MDLDTNTIRQFSHDPNNPGSLSFNGVTSILPDNAGNLWVGTFGGGLNYLAAGSDKFVHYRSDKSNPHSLNNDRVLAIHTLVDGTLAVGTVAGLNLLDPVSMKFERIEHEVDNIHSLSAPMAWAFHQDGVGQLWIGTQGGGLNKWAKEDMASLTNKFERFDRFNGLPSSHIYAILEDDDRRLWLSSTAGITRFDPQHSDAIRHFARNQGLKDSEFNFGAAFKDSKGMMYFGGNSGFVRFDPSEIIDNDVIPPLALTRIKKLNEQVWFDVPYQQLNDLELNYRDYLVSFEFSALDYHAPNLNQYRYKLEGLDQDWIELEHRRIATFTNLPAGEYVLKVQASNSQGLWNAKGFELPIKMLPPPWRSNWAYGLYTLLILLLLFNLAWRFRRKRLQEIQRLIELEEKVSERTQELTASNKKLEASMVETEQARKLAEQASKEKSDFLAIMSHEIRTPMNGVLGMTEVLLSSELKPKQRHFAQLVYRSGRLLLDLLNNILDFSKLEAGKASLESVPVDLELLIEEVCDLFSEAAYNKGIRINAILAPKFVPKVYADPARLRQIIANLTSNAIKFTESGEVNVSVEISESNNNLTLDSKQRLFVISVEDTGIGMAPDRQQKVFEMFTQADASTTRKYGGTGLGLAICKQLTSLMAGELKVESQIDVGSCFRLEVVLPVVETKNQAEQAAIDFPTVHLVGLNSGLERALTNLLTKLKINVLHMQRVKPELKSARNGSWISAPEFEPAIIEAGIPLEKWICLVPISQWRERENRNILTLPVHINHLKYCLNRAIGIEGDWRHSQIETNRNHQVFNASVLVAEDSLTNQEVAKSMLSLLGCEAWIADNGAEAIEQVNLLQPDLVLMDCQMPVMDGYAATKVIRQHWPDLPIVALTAGLVDNLRQSCLDSGMNDVMSKPFSLQELEQCLKCHLQQTDENHKEVVSKTNGTSSLSQLSPIDVPSNNLESVNEQCNKVKVDDIELIDLETIDTLIKISKDTGNPVFARVLDAFNQEAETLVKELAEQTEKSDINLGNIAIVAHALKSMSGNTGAKALYELCHKMEEFAKAEQAEPLVTISKQIQGVFLESREQLESFRNGN